MYSVINILYSFPFDSLKIFQGEVSSPNKFLIPLEGIGEKKAKDKNKRKSADFTKTGIKHLEVQEGSHSSNLLFPHIIKERIYVCVSLCSELEANDIMNSYKIRLKW